jgi:hypothetical protein
MLLSTSSTTLQSDTTIHIITEATHAEVSHIIKAHLFSEAYHQHQMTAMVALGKLCALCLLLKPGLKNLR